MAPPWPASATSRAEAKRAVTASLKTTTGRFTPMKWTCMGADARVRSCMASMLVLRI